MRLDPPTGRMRVISPVVRPAERIVRSRTSMVSSMRGEMSSSNSERVMRSCVDGRPGRFTVMVASVSSLSASFAARQLSRRSASAAESVGSAGSSADSAPPSAAFTWERIAWSKSMPPSRSIPSGVPAREKPTSDAISTAESNVPPPKS
jgi:hypothetical protein